MNEIRGLDDNCEECAEKDKEISELKEWKRSRICKRHKRPLSCCLDCTNEMFREELKPLKDENTALKRTIKTLNDSLRSLIEKEQREVESLKSDIDRIKRDTRHVEKSAILNYNQGKKEALDALSDAIKKKDFLSIEGEGYDSSYNIALEWVIEKIKEISACPSKSDA